ncbi:MAG: phosphoribosyl-ATP diphosphatase [Burkholderiaceae bacterium]|nr:phosphoribosyl-ATP diphosphatase [Burkholderiaceae bacterium]
MKDAGFDAGTLARLADVIEARRGGDPQRSYVARLLAQGPDAILKKIGEEATETVLAAKDGSPERIVSELADLWFHCLVALAAYGLRPETVLAELERRAGTSGLDEKASRQAAQKAAHKSALGELPVRGTDG